MIGGIFHIAKNNKRINKFDFWGIKGSVLFLNGENKKRFSKFSG
tara:strand:+ start:1137 stop:1268 length:132 start_codon:yes stop_codon:yes gene_type:complete